MKEVGRVRHPAKRTAGKRRINIEEATGTCYTERNSKEKIESFV